MHDTNGFISAALAHIPANALAARTRPVWTALVTFTTVISIASALQARDYVVCPQGADAAAGTREAPFRSISRAAAVMLPGDVCLVRQGHYRETVRPAASGEPGRPIIFRAWPGERPTILGGDPVTGWQRVQGDIWRAPMAWGMPHGNQVFINGQPGREARWPNKTNNDPLDWEAAAYDKGSDNRQLICRQLPSRPDGYWKGAVLWVMAGAKWTSWSVPVTGYTDEARRIEFALTSQAGSVDTHMSPSDGRGGFFYLVGKQAEIDQPGEWFADTAAKTLYLQVEPGADPNALSIEAQSREWAFDFRGLKHLHAEGFAVLGASLDLSGSSHCLIKGFEVRWLAHVRGGNTAYGLNVPTGIRVGGEFNTVRDSLVAYSAGNGINLSGRSNAVINCWIHDTDYTGSYDAPIKIWGEAMLVSHNSIHDTGRDCIQPSGQAHIIQYNRIFNMGRLAHDLGGTYVCSSDGGGTEFRFNWVHDNLAHGTRMGIYLDNFTSNYLVYNNVVWNINGCDIRLNKPSLYNFVINNTMLGKSGNWGRWPTDWMYNCAYVNNAVAEKIDPHPQAVFAHNLFKIPAETLNKDTFTAYRAEQKGLAVPGITGANPAIGAYSVGHDWRAGHDFSSPPDVTYAPADTPLRNLVAHGSFDWLRFHGKLGPWRTFGAGAAAVIHGTPGGIEESYTARDTIINAGVRLGTETDDGIEQTVTGLRPEQSYELSAWAKTDGTASLTLALPEYAATVKSAATNTWQLLTVRFQTGSDARNGTVRIIKHGPGRAFVDDVGLVGVIAGMEPRLPGLALINR